MWVNEQSWTGFLTFLCVDFKDRSQRPSRKGWSAEAKPLSRNSLDSNYRVGWLLRTLLPSPAIYRELLRRSRPHTSHLFQPGVHSRKPQRALGPYPNYCEVCVYSDCCSFMPLMQQSSWNSSEVPPQDKSHGFQLCSWVCFLSDTDTLIHSTEQYETLWGAKMENLCWQIKRVTDVVHLMSLKVTVITAWTMKVTWWTFPLVSHPGESASVGWRLLKTVWWKGATVLFLVRWWWSPSPSHTALDDI